jgi:ABC-type Fe3+/spermidine/putrescine transport system ATPase subunit
MDDNILTLNRVSKKYNHSNVINQINMNIRKGEIFTLLGPSGCGKTTTLRLIAGLERLNGGEIYYKGQIIASGSTGAYVPPHKRNIGMVFQSYAIWPHLTVFDNVAYPLQARGTEKKKMHEKVHRVLELVGLNGFENRPGPMLSGGQQQRVALARALVYEPDLLLLDEPFSNLDIKLREQMRVEIKLLQRQLGISILLVTHDQLEALSMSDNIAVMNAGQIIQVDSPLKLYEEPQSTFVRDFLGKSALLQGKIVSYDSQDQMKVVLHDSGAIFEAKNTYLSEATVDTEIFVSARPEDIVLEIGHSDHNNNRLNGKIKALLFIGDRFECHVQVGQHQIFAYLPRRIPCYEGQEVQLYFPGEALSVWPKS